MLDTRRAELFEAELRNYFLCEEQGVDPTNPGLCDEFRNDYHVLSTPELSAMAFILLSLIPTVILIYTVDFVELNENWMKLMNYLKMCPSSKYNSRSEMTVETSMKSQDLH